MGIVLSDAERRKMMNAGIKQTTNKLRSRVIFDGTSTFKVGDEFVIEEDYDVFENTRLLDGEGNPTQLLKVAVEKDGRTLIKDVYPSMFTKAREEYTTDVNKVPIPTGVVKETQGDVCDLVRSTGDLADGIDAIAMVCAGKLNPDGTPGTGQKYKVRVTALNPITTLRFGTADKLQSTKLGTYEFVKA